MTKDAISSSSMFFFTFTAKPKPESRNAKLYDGAYINCWINFNLADGAKLLARYYIEKRGWIATRKTDERWVEKEDYEPTPEWGVYFSEAEESGACFVFHTYTRKLKK
ncbi:MAG TPA: hypothetical protein VFZ34_17580 [Blastocatellia bacterium]|nr:hypothetical protein [Blastocatellia bacterium]